MSNTFAIKEVLDFVVESYSATGRGKLLLNVDYAGETSINTTAERLSIRGGQGNFKIIDLDHTKDCEFAATLPLVDINALAIKLGKAIQKGTGIAVFDKVLVVDKEGEIKLPDGITPEAGTLKIYKVEFERDLGVEMEAATETPTAGKYKIAAGTLTFNKTDCPEGTRLLVSFDYKAGADSQNIKITATDFPEFITIRGRGLVNDDQEGTIIPITFKVHKAKVRPEFELTMAGESATELDFSCDCYTVFNLQGEREFVDIVKLNDETLGLTEEEETAGED